MSFPLHSGLRGMTNQQQTNSTTVAPRGDREIVSERVFDAPRERVFEAFTDPTHV